MTLEEAWRRLLILESRDGVTSWYSNLHGRDLNARRAKEINSSARQGREFFRSASETAYSVRPLLTFYGVACLSRALVLLLRKNGGEETLTQGHGLETVSWNEHMSGDLGDALRRVPNLMLRMRSGLFSELVGETHNETTIHIQSEKVDWQIPYSIPPSDSQVSLDDIASRIPDLVTSMESAGAIVRCATANGLKFTTAAGFEMTFQNNSALKEWLVAANYTIAQQGTAYTAKCSADHFSRTPILFVHTYVRKTFGAIPDLYAAAPIQGQYYSQIALTYLISFFLGMLVRYYPTHWMALNQGDKGDSWWPVLSRAQHLVETSFPELVVEFIEHRIKTASTRSADGDSPSAAATDPSNS